MPTFEWNPVKARKNLAKHRVDFEAAKNVFLDPAGVVELDYSDPHEERWRIIGLVGIKLLFVIFTEPDEDVIHIISAREANKREERRYFGQEGP
jgi:uncharacterized protein